MSVAQGPRARATATEAKAVWLARAGQHGEDEEAALELGAAVIGFHNVPDLSRAENVAEILRLVRSAYPADKESRSDNRARQLDAFVNRINEGDVIALPLKQTPGMVALGRVTGRYKYRDINGAMRHTRPVKWIRPDVSRGEFAQDLLYSLGAFMTVCRIQRNDAQRRFAAVIAGDRDPGPGEDVLSEVEAETAPAVENGRSVDIAQIAQDQIVAHIQTKYTGHGLAVLVEAVLQADGFVTQRSPEGPDGGVDILAGRGSLGLDGPSLCVQVKSSSSPSDVNVFRALKGTMQTFGARQGLLVSWGGFTRSVLNEARQSFFNVRLWNANDLVEAIYRRYDRLSEEVQAELPLKRVWALVPEGQGS